jgi:hypothetical protein
MSVVGFAVAQLIANKCVETTDPNDALRRFSEQLYTRIESGSTPESLQEIMTLMSSGVDDLIRSAQVALGE